ncbi:WXG100 family type VII secretion target [Thermoflexus sp.]|uniref:WXG100 family type VII secretion target n=1 Tax=Thermoflexus sp. TaxID=1969742 RepID=UPI0035E45B96
MPISRFDYDAMLAIARRIEQGGADLEAYLERVQAAAQGLEEQCRSPFAEALQARSAEWVRAGMEIARSLKALGVDLARIVEAQRTAEEQEGARFAHLPE